MKAILVYQNVLRHRAPIPPFQRYSSKSSASGSSGFECFNQSVVAVGVSDKTIKVGSVTIPVTSAVSSPQTTTISGSQTVCYKKSHKKSKKSIERSRSGQNFLTQAELIEPVLPRPDYLSLKVPNIDFDFYVSVGCVLWQTVASKLNLM